MRERKYRAWDKKHKCWYETELKFYGFHLFGECTLICPPRAEDLQHLEVTEWTGLKDKNGIEIYEGDIVATPFGYNCEIRWNVNGHWGYWRTVDGATYKEDYWECEVIGNIYENPELLKGA